MCPKFNFLVLKKCIRDLLIQKKILNGIVPWTFHSRTSQFIIEPKSADIAKTVIILSQEGTISTVNDSGVPIGTSSRYKLTNNGVICVELDEKIAVNITG